ncbi:hypothetical protein BGZ83_010970 [Gryganskiella cystojenkinii]|nr:hypothetical protein BGZ83_010970 [Gryganskiella cystojenkinii]
MSSVILRQAGPADAALLSKIGASTFTSTFGHMYSEKNLKDYLTATYTIERHLASISDPRESFWLMEDENGQALGFGYAGACKLPVKDLEPNAGEIKRFYILPEHQGKRLGSQLLERMIHWLEDNKFGPLYIGVWSENFGAHRLYGRYGFEKFSEYEFEVGGHRDHEFIFKRA